MDRRPQLPVFVWLITKLEGNGVFTGSVSRFVDRMRLSVTVRCDGITSPDLSHHDSDILFAQILQEAAAECALN